MYEYLKGTLVERKPARVVIDVGGVGYEVWIPVSTYGSLPRAGGAATLLVHYHLREDLAKLYGFATPAERALFRTLIGITGIGPAVAIQILSSSTIARFYEAVEARDEKFITRIKGIGKKTAQRLIVELAGRLPELEPAAGAHCDGADDPNADARGALETLGVPADRAEVAIKKARAQLAKEGDESPTADTLVRAALRHS